MNIIMKNLRVLLYWQKNDRNNNINTGEPTSNEPDIERANDLGPGDAGLNDRKMTR